MSFKPVVPGVALKPVTARGLPVPRGDGSRDAPRPSWSPATVDGKKTALVRCGDCGGGALLDHDIADDGKVSPSLGCPFCGWHVFIRLEGWMP